jgi:CRISPR-associated protein Cmr3
MSASAKGQWTGLRLDPLDVLFFRDGRPFDAAHRVSGGLPNPQTLSGALRTALLAQAGFRRFADFARERRENPNRPVKDVLFGLGAAPWVVHARFRGPWLAFKSAPNQPLLPVPAVWTRAKDDERKWYRNAPLPDALPGWEHSQGLLPLWRQGGGGPAKAPPGYLNLADIGRFLAAEEGGPKEYLPEERLFEQDPRIGIVIEGRTLAAVEGQLYGIELLALRREVCLYAEMLPGEGAPDRTTWWPKTIPFGGEGKYVAVEILPAPAPWPHAAASTAHSLWLLATPAFVGKGRPWPAGLPQAPRLKAAASGNPLAISGWDVARGGPLATRFAVPAGSVYFVEGDYTPDRESLCSAPDPVAQEHVAQGWGFALRGVWNNG